MDYTCLFGGADVLSKNHVFIQGGTTYYGIVYGCWSKSGAVKENRVDMSVGNVNFAYGGWSVNGDATDNTVALTGGKISGDAYGGHSNNGAVTGNKVAISGGTALWVCGGHSENGAVTKNTVAITGGTVGIAQGGYATQYGAVTNNTVTLAGGTVKLVVGGQSDNNGDVTDNTVTISGGTVQYSDVGVYGGRSVKGTVKNNHVNISAGTVDGSYPSTSSGIFGGCSYNGAATNNNTVTITGGKITGKVVGGASNTATDNNIILAKGAAAANLQSATLYGSIRDASYHGDVSLPDTHSGNTLTVEGEKNITVANVKNFDIYNFVLPADVQNEAPFLIINDGGDTDLGKASVTVTGEPALSLNTGDTLYLLKKTSGALTNIGETNLVYTNKAGNATVRTPGTLASDGKMTVGDKTYCTFDLSPDVTNGYKFLASKYLAKKKIGIDNVAVTTSGGVLSKGDRLALVDGTAVTPTYTGDAKAVDVTYENDDKTATIQTTGTVKADGKNLVLDIDGVKYHFVLAPTMVKGDTFLTSANTGETKIDADDVTLDESKLANQMLSLRKGDTVYLLKNDTAGTLAYTETSGAKELNHTYENSTDAGTATVTTHGKVEASGNDLVLNVNNVNYTFTLAPAVTSGAKLLSLSSAGETKIYQDDVKVTASDALKNLKAKDKVYLIQNTGGGKLSADGTKTVTLPIVFQNVTGTVAAVDNNLVLTITNAESLTPADSSYKYIVIVEDATKSAKNAVTVGTGETADKSAIAALAKSDTDDTELKDNTLTVNGKVTDRAVGANSVAGNATQNNVTIGAGATVDGFVAGGMTQDGTANNNTVTINGGTVTGDVYGGYSEKEATGNTVTMSGGTVKGTIYGSNLGSGASSGTTVKKSSPRRAPALTETESTSSGNTMKIYGKDNTAGNLAKFDNYNFYLPAGTSNGATMLHLTDKADTDMTNSKVTVRANGALNLYNNESVYLIKKDGGSLLTNATIDQDVDLTVGVTAALKGTVENKDNNLVLNIAGPERPKSSGSSGSSRSSSGSSESSNTSSAENAECASSTSESSSSGSSSSASTPVVTINPDTKSAVETRAAQSNVVNMGSDYLVTTTMAQVANADYGADGFASFGGSSGSAHMRYKTGSHVDSRGTAFNAGIAKKNTNKSGTFTWGPFFETGHGNYDSYLDNGTHGSGSTSYTGGGIFARQEFASGLYVEGSLRTGKTKADYSSSDLGTGYSTNAPYFGAHLGVGRVLPMDGGSLDIYGRYLYSRTGSDSVHLATGETYDFDAVDSHRLMLGTRYTREMDKLSKWYAGAALLYEFGGEARAHYQGYSLASPSSAGTSVMLEGGWKYTPSANSPFELDLGATGWLGKQQGLMFHAGVNYAF